jgi:hypothetical protein
MFDKIIEQIMNHPDLLAEPPIFVDVGASGKIHGSWSKLAKYAICIGFDADLRDFSTEQKDSGYNKLILINKIISDTPGIKKFYLTKNPHCSSTLNPNLDSLDDWYFKDLFIVEKIRKIEANTINNVLKSLDINKIDWFKTDSQGTDLRIFKAINPSIQKRVLSAEFEPGVVDAYKDEDKLFSIFQYMNDNFFIDDIVFKGSIRSKPYTVAKHFPKLHNAKINVINITNKSSKLWAEIHYLNNFNDNSSFKKRDFLLFCAILIIKKQYLFCIEICDRHIDHFNDDLVEKIRKHCLFMVRINAFKLSYQLPLILIKKIFL